MVELESEPSPAWHPYPHTYLPPPGASQSQSCLPSTASRGSVDRCTPCHKHTPNSAEAHLGGRGRDWHSCLRQLEVGPEPGIPGLSPLSRGPSPGQKGMQARPAGRDEEGTLGKVGEKPGEDVGSSGLKETQAGRVTPALVTSTLSPRYMTGTAPGMGTWSLLICDPLPRPP